MEPSSEARELGQLYHDVRGSSVYYVSMWSFTLAEPRLERETPPFSFGTTWYAVCPVAQSPSQIAPGYWRSSGLVLERKRDEQPLSTMVERCLPFFINFFLIFFHHLQFLTR